MQVVNVYLASTIWYTAQVLPLPASYRKQIDQELGRFIFRGRITMGRLKMEQLCHPVTKGGLGLFNTERKAKALFTRQTSRMLSRKRTIGTSPTGAAPPWPTKSPSMKTAQQQARPPKASTYR